MNLQANANQLLGMLGSIKTSTPKSNLMADKHGQYLQQEHAKYQQQFNDANNKRNAYIQKTAGQQITTRQQSYLDKLTTAANSLHEQMTASLDQINNFNKLRGMLTTPKVNESVKGEA